jgi:DNA-binding transcriptional MerR regulator
MNGYSVSQLARATGVGAETVRHYEDIGLLPKAARTDSGYRLFPATSLQRMSFVGRCKSLGFSLSEIRELLELSDRRQTDVQTDMRTLLELTTAKVADVSGRIADLERMREGLNQLAACCPGKGSLAACPILSALTTPSAPANG